MQADENELTADQIAAKLNGLPKGRVPLGCQHLTMFIDVQQKLLFYAICAWAEEFSGAVLEYGAWPDPQRSYFSLRDVTRTLSTVTPGTGLEGAIYAGLQALTERQLAREWHREDGASLRIERCLIDANWGTSTDVVYQFCRQSPHAALLLPSHGRFVGASSLPFADYKRRPGDRVGLNWRIPGIMGKRSVRHVSFDTNFWKSFVFARLAVAMADKGSLALFGQKPEPHRLFAEHMTAEYRVRTEGRGRTVDEWKPRCKHLHPASLKLDLELRLRLHSFYAVALANLDRFHEAHRHFTEALAIQSKHLWASPRVELAKLSLRRAEVILTEAHRVGHVLKVFAKRVATTKPTTAELITLLEGNGMYASIPDPVGPSKNQLYDVELHQSIRECLVVGNNCADIVIEKLRRLLAAMLDDAWFSIENAEKALAGHSQSSLWCGRVALMKLRACGYQLNLWIQSPESASSGQAVKQATFRDPELKMLAYSHRRITPQGMWRLFEAARLNDRRSALNMKYREIRLVRYIAGCLRVFAHCKDETDFVSSKAKELGRLYLDPHFLRKEGLSLSPELKNLFVFTKEAVRQAVNNTKGS